MYCTNCGNKLNGDAYCSNCGKQIKTHSSFGFGVLGFFFPVIGLILFCVWIGSRKKDAKSAIIGTIIGFILHVILFLLIFYFVVSIIDNTDCFSVCNGHFEYKDGLCICQDVVY